jgi:hypothetical protein
MIVETIDHSPASKLRTDRSALLQKLLAYVPSKKRTRRTDQLDDGTTRSAYTMFRIAVHILDRQRNMIEIGSGRKSPKRSTLEEVEHAEYKNRTRNNIRLVAEHAETNSAGQHTARLSASSSG